MARVELEGLEKRYPNGFCAVQGISLDLPQGDFTVLVGPSGCGKTTTLRMIAGLESITAGELRIGGRRVNELAPKDRDIAMVFQSYALYPHMTVRGNLAFGLKLRKTPPDEIRARIDEVAELLGLGDLLDRHPKQMSGGQRQRVALGRAIVRRPAVFLFDEPLSNLDAKLRVQMRLEISRLHRRLGATSVYVTHDQVEAMTLASRIVVLDGGRVQQVGPPLELYDRPANLFVATFLGSPAMNVLPVTLEHSEGVGEGFRVPLPEGLSAPEAREARLGVRPQHLALGPPGQGADARIEAVEPMGNETNVYCLLGGAQIVVRADPTARPTPGDRVGVVFDPRRLHLFDASTGERLG